MAVSDIFPRYRSRSSMFFGDDFVQQSSSFVEVSGDTFNSTNSFCSQRGEMIPPGWVIPLLLMMIDEEGGGRSPRLRVLRSYLLLRTILCFAVSIVTS